MPEPRPRDGVLLAAASATNHHTEAVAALLAELDARPPEQNTVQRRLLARVDCGRMATICQRVDSTRGEESTLAHVKELTEPLAAP